MKATKTILFLWIVIALIATLLGINQLVQERTDDVSVTTPEAIHYCLPLDIDGDGRILLKDFASFAKSFNKPCVPVGEGEYSVVSEFEIKNDPSSLDIRNYLGVELDIDLSNHNVLAVVPGTKTGWFNALGTCDPNNVSILFQNGTICYAIAAYINKFAQQETFGKVFVPETAATTLTPESVSIYYSDGEVLSNEVTSVLIQKVIDKASDEKQYTIELRGNSKTNVNGNGIELHLTFENANIISFSPNIQSWTLAPLPCENSVNGSFMFSNTSICASFAKPTKLTGNEIFGTVVLDPIVNTEPIRVSFGSDAAFTEGTALTDLTGVFTTLSTPESAKCGYVDIVKNNEPAGQPNVTLQDFAAFVLLFNKPTCDLAQLGG